MGDRTPGHDDAPVGEIEVFATGTTVLRAEADEVHTRSSPLLDDWPLPVDDGQSSRGYHARSGHRPGVPRAAAASSSRRGDSADVVRPMFVAPERVVTAIDDGDALDAVRHLRIRPDDPVSSRWLTWPVALTLWPRRPVAATLHVRASPSMVVTVIELVPARRLRWGRRRFVHRGVAAIESLAARIEHASPSG